MQGNRSLLMHPKPLRNAATPSASQVVRGHTLIVAWHYYPCRRLCVVEHADKSRKMSDCLLTEEPDLLRARIAQGCPVCTHGVRHLSSPQ